MGVGAAMVSTDWVVLASLWRLRQHVKEKSGKLLLTNLQNISYRFTAGLNDLIF
jgi:hypothetical protein